MTVEEEEEPRLMADAWSALVAGAPPATDVAPPVLTGQRGALPAALAVESTATACVAVALMAASALHSERSGASVDVALDREHVAFAVRSERYFLRGDESLGAGFAPLSRFWRAADGWVRTHANYPWHRAALLGELGSSAEAEDAALIDALADAIALRSASELEESVFAAGGIAAAVRTVDEWRAHPQGAAVAAEPLVSCEAFIGAGTRTHQPAAQPVAGIRVLDLTRVIAGPVCTRYLGALGADVLRIDPPAYPDMAPGALADTLLAKRSAMFDAHDASSLHELLHVADVVVVGYRPHALDRFGLDARTLVERYPGIVVVVLDAWGHTGPWCARRGFDSVVQAPTGIAHASSRSTEPGALPCQLLDHGTGYLAAAAALDGVRRQRRDGGSYVRRLSLARTAAWLMDQPVADDGAAATQPVGESGRWTQRIDDVEATAPPGSFNGHALSWPARLTRYCGDAPQWQPA